MRKIINIAAAVLVLAAPVAVASSASAASVNFGACSSQVEPWQHRYIAPGQSGNGPLTGEMGGNLHFPPAFAGGMGCLK